MRTFLMPLLLSSVKLEIVRIKAKEARCTWKMGKAFKRKTQFRPLPYTGSSITDLFQCINYRYIFPTPKTTFQRIHSDNKYSTRFSSNYSLIRNFKDFYTRKKLMNLVKQKWKGDARN